MKTKMVSEVVRIYQIDPEPFATALNSEYGIVMTAIPFFHIFEQRKFYLNMIKEKKLIDSVAFGVKCQHQTTNPIAWRFNLQKGG